MKVRTLLTALACAGACLLASTGASAAPIDLAVTDPVAFAADPTDAFAEVHDANGREVRLVANFGDIAPGGVTKPSGFDASNPDDPMYNWATLDRQIRAAVAAGLEPIVCADGLPAWAGGSTTPNTRWLATFAETAARRYNGATDGLPRVKYWQAWNEPNLGGELMPQRGVNGLLSPELYRSMVNAFARGVKRVHYDNLVIAGGLAPYASTTGAGIPPLTFMKQFLCLTGARVRPRPSCLQPVMFDIWSMQPYTWGGPTHHATVPGDIALGDLPAVRSALDQAVAGGRVVSSAPMKFWVTEFSWDTNPPDPGGVAVDLQARWTAQAVYEMWQSGVSLVTWWLIRDRPFPERWQSGLYFNGGSYAADTPKPTFEAVRFPFVAFVQPGGVFVWARTPEQSTGFVTFQQDTGSGVWAPIGVLAADSDGVATGVLSTAFVTGSVRAVDVATGETSNAFSLTDVPDQVVDPFGN